jgi:DNA repair protein RadA/Sms
MASKTKQAPRYRCGECGWTTIKWVGRCGECQAWGSVEEIGSDTTRGRTAATSVSAPAKRIAEVDATSAGHRRTAIPEFDRVLGGGLVPGAVVLLAGEPGVGKSTLLLDVAARVARQGGKVLYVTGEESAAQVKMRADRIHAVADSLYLAAESDLGQALGQVDSVEPDLLIVDSVQTLSSAEVDGVAGGVSQVREVAAGVIGAAKDRNIATILVGHVTKDGSIAGPRLLEHLVDVVCQFEGERHSRLRLLRAVKNRYGSTDEVGCFDLTTDGIEGLDDPTRLFLTRTPTPVAGTCVTVAMEGLRPIVAEVQALLTPSEAPAPKRSATGLDSSRVSMLLAVLRARAGLNLAKQESYVATVGGVKLSEPSVDLAVALAVASSFTETPLPNNVVAFGEVGLAGELRPVRDLGQRITEAERLGFVGAVFPRTQQLPSQVPQDFKLVPVDTLTEALEVFFHSGTGASHPGFVTQPNSINQ